MHPISSQEESWFPVFDWRFEPTFHQHLKWSFQSAIGMWEGPCVFCLKWNGPERPWLKRRRTFLQCLKFRLVLHITRWRDVWIPCGDARDSHSSPPHLERGITSLWYLERHTEFKASKGDDAWFFLKMNRNPNITVSTWKWALVSCLTSRSVRIVLPSLV